MPTIYTTLQAQHVHPLPRLPLPKGQAGKREIGRALLATAHKRKKKPPKAKRRIAVIGGGFAGLCAAFELQALKYDVKVYEVRDRVGGRVHSLKIKSIGREVIEGGGELIGSNHPLWNAYRQRFKLTFTDAKDYGNSPVRMKNKTLSFEKAKKLWKKYDKLVNKLTDLAETIEDPYEPWINLNARRLDNLSVGDWIRKTKAHENARKAMMAQLEADNGVDANDQSLLGVLAMVKGGGLDRYWSDTELYRCEGGNDRLAKKFRAALNKKHRVVFEEHQVMEVRRVERVPRVSGTAGNKKKAKDDKARQEVALIVKKKAGGKWRSLEQMPRFDRVILAVPPSVWSRIKFDDSAPKALGSPPKMGKNTKYLIGLKKRVWEDYSSSPNLTEDGPVNITWETTEESTRPNYAMVAFSGGRAAKRLSQMNDMRARRTVLAALKAPYPRLRQKMTGGKFMNWPEEEWTMCSYYFPRKGDVTEWGPLWQGGHDDWLEFAGEHTCFAFMGYMEGALASGFRLARRLAVRDRVLRA